MYRYTDENGQIVISSTIPQEASRRGYDILSKNGRVIETIDPEPTEEEIAAREAEEKTPGRSGTTAGARSQASGALQPPRRSRARHAPQDT